MLNPTVEPRKPTLLPPHFAPAAAQVLALGWPPGGVAARLTKKYLMSVAAGSFLVSNLIDNGESVFTETVACSVPGCLAQWDRIVNVGANQCLCYVYESKQEYDLLREEQILVLKRIGTWPSWIKLLGNG